MATIAARLTSTGTLLVNGAFDEVTQSTISTRANLILASEFDEVTISGGAVAQRQNSNGNIQLAGILDEVTGTTSSTTGAVLLSGGLGIARLLARRST